MGTSTDRALFQPLHRRPEARTVTVRELIQKMRNGEIRVPEFQRPLRWEAEDARQLLDSIWRGYPIGSLLCWKRAAEAENIKVGGARLSVPAISDAWLVVDGQQRVTTLAATLLELDHGSERRWTHFFDAGERSFHAGAPSPHRVGIDVPVHVLGDLSRLGRWLRQHQIEDDSGLVRAIEEAQQALLDYVIPVHIVETEDEKTLRVAFSRLNSTGARMRADEVFQALLGVRSGEGEALDLTRLQVACDLGGFGAPPRSEVLKAVLAMSGLDPARRAEQLTQEELTRLVSAEDAQEALISTVSFLQDDAGIPHWKLIPHPAVLPVLARFFHVHGATWGDANANRLVRVELVRWLWRGAAQGATVSALHNQIDMIEPAAYLYDSLDQLRGAVAATRSGDWVLEPFDHHGTRSRVEVLALLSLMPRDLFGRISPRALGFQDEFTREIFTTASLRGESEETQALARTAANRVVLDSSQSGLDAWIVETSSMEMGEEILRSHLVTEDMVESLATQDSATFLRERARLLQCLSTTFLDARCGWGEPLLRPLSHYFGPRLESGS